MTAALLPNFAVGRPVTGVSERVRVLDDKLALCGK